MHENDNTGPKVIPPGKVFHMEPMRTETGEIRSSGRLTTNRFKKRLEAQKRSI